MENLWADLLSFFNTDRVAVLMQALLTVILGLILARLLSASLVKLLARQINAHRQMIVRRVSFYTIAGLSVASALVELGFNFGVLLGAAGILTVALSFASQTSASNIISGLFLLGEKPFSIGDVIRIGSTQGEVLSIDLLSVKLRTFDNLFVRVANENLIKSEIVNLTRFPIRRLDLPIGVAYKEDLRAVMHVLNEVAHRNPICMEEPKPVFIFQGYGDSSLNFQFSVWAQREKFLELKTSIQIEIKEAFDQHGIEIPFPHRSLYAGSVTDPFPVRVMNGSVVSGEESD